MRAIAVSLSAKVDRHQNTILGSSGHQSSLPVVPIDSQCMTSVVTLGRYKPLKSADCNHQQEQQLHHATMCMSESLGLYVAAKNLSN